MDIILQTCDTNIINSNTYLYYIREGRAMVSSFKMPILPPSLLNYKRIVKIKISTQRKLPKNNLQHFLTNHLKEGTLQITHTIEKITL